RPGVADVDAVTEDGAVDADVAVAIALEVAADEFVGRSLDDALDLPSRVAARARLAEDLDQHLVAVGGVLRVFRVDEDFRADGAVVRPHDAVAAGEPAEDAGDA